MPTPEPLNIQLTLEPGSGGGPREAEEQARALRREIQGLPVEEVGFVSSGPAPAGARSAEVLMAGTVAVTLLTPLLPKLLDVVSAWLQNRKGRAVRVKVSRGTETIEVEFAPGERSEKEILSFVEKLDARLGQRPGA